MNLFGKGNRLPYDEKGRDLRYCQPVSGMDMEDEGADGTVIVEGTILMEVEDGTDQDY